MPDNPTLSLLLLEEKIPYASIEEVKVFMEHLEKEKELYTRIEFIHAHSLISKRLIEISKDLRIKRDSA